VRRGRGWDNNMRVAVSRGSIRLRRGKGRRILRYTRGRIRSIADRIIRRHTGNRTRKFM